MFSQILKFPAFWIFSRFCGINSQTLSGGAKQVERKEQIEETFIV